MTIPMIWGILAVVSVTITDTFFVGQLGTLPLAAMGFVFPIAMVMFSLGIGLSAGAASVIARTIGGSSREEVRRLATDALSLSFIISVLFVLVGISTIDPVFRMLGAKDDTLPLITAYMTPTYIGIIFLIVPMTGNSVLRACGDAKWPAMIMIGSAGINAVLDPILIFGLLGMPRMEIAGAAWATMIARLFILFSVFAILHFRERLISNLWPGLKTFTASARKILHIAIPAAMNQMLNPLAMALLTAMVATFGTGAVAAFGVATRIEA
ncbi:MAG: MATE family efflux transporter, partial [Rhodospirillales bacterium]|nr:MATE family efflux transporter [Rhodospirillales bacterium]